MKNKKHTPVCFIFPISKLSPFKNRPRTSVITIYFKVAYFYLLKNITRLKKINIVYSFKSFTKLSIIKISLEAEIKKTENLGVFKLCYT